MAGLEDGYNMINANSENSQYFCTENASHGGKHYVETDKKEDQDSYAWNFHKSGDYYKIKNEDLGSKGYLCTENAQRGVKRYAETDVNEDEDAYLWDF